MSDTGALSFLRFNRRLSAGLAAALAGTGISPNVVTAVGLVCGLLAASMLSQGVRLTMFAGVVLLHLTFILDSTDGDLARLTGRQSRFGGWFDVFSDVAVDLALWTGLWLACRAGSLGAHVDFFYFAACAGSVLNFVLILAERNKGVSFHVADSIPTNPFFAVLESLAHNGVSILLAYAAALSGDARLFLAGGAMFVSALALARVIANFRGLGLARPPVLLKTATLALGVFALLHTFRFVSWNEIGPLLNKIGFGILFVLAVFPIACFFHALGLYYLFPDQARRRAGFLRLYLIYLLGDSLNKITPLADVGGEPVKVAFLRKSAGFRLSESVNAVYVSRMMLVVTETVLMAVGLALVMSFKPSAYILTFGLAAIAVSIAFLCVLLFSESAVASLLHRAANIGSGHSANREMRVRETIGRFMGSRRADLVRSFAWNEIAWVFFLFEIYAALRILDVPIGLGEAFLVHAALRTIQTATFFIPVNLGSQEGGLVYLATHLGLSSAHGMTLSLIKRLRQIVYGTLGALFFVLYREDKPVPLVSG